MKDFDRVFLGWVPPYAVNPFWVPRPRLCVGVSSNVKRIHTPTQSRGREHPIGKPSVSLAEKRVTTGDSFGSPVRLPLGVQSQTNLATVEIDRWCNLLDTSITRRRHWRVKGTASGTRNRKRVTGVECHPEVLHGAAIQGSQSRMKTKPGGNPRVYTFRTFRAPIRKWRGRRLVRTATGPLELGIFEC